MRIAARISSATPVPVEGSPARPAEAPAIRSRRNEGDITAGFSLSAAQILVANPHRGTPTMEYGAHLPIIDFDGRPWSLERLRAYAATAERLGFKYLCVNDHLVFTRPWLDCLTALTAVLDSSGSMRLVTSVALPVVRGPVALAKSLAALDVLSGGRLIVGLGPGSSARDYAAAGVPFEERWRRFDETVRVMRSLLVRDEPEFRGKYYSTEGVTLQPYPLQEPGPPLWIGSWGSEAGLRRAARFGDGWLASAYNTTPEGFAAAWNRIRQ